MTLYVIGSFFPALAARIGLRKSYFFVIGTGSTSPEEKDIEWKGEVLRSQVQL
jgi:hypothetical protein